MKVSLQLAALLYLYSPVFSRAILLETGSSSRTIIIKLPPHFVTRENFTVNMKAFVSMEGETPVINLVTRRKKHSSVLI